MRKSDFSQKIPITRFKIYVFKISAKFLNCLHQHFFRALPSPVNIVCNRGCSFFFLPLSPSNSFRPLFSRYSPIVAINENCTYDLQKKIQIFDYKSSQAKRYTTPTPTSHHYYISTPAVLLLPCWQSLICFVLSPLREWPSLLKSL